jgi:3-oxoacyl-[acyl-carrier protein] reductase
MGVLDGRTALVTGAGRGIGRAIALKFAAAGADVVVCARTASQIESVAQEVEALGRKAIARPLDVGSLDDVQAVVEEVLQAWGKIDVVVNNAGVTRDALLLRLTPEMWEEVLDINLTGTFNVTKAVARSMLKQKSGRIINITSVIGQMGNVGQANYAASKGGIIAFTKSVAKEFASRGITVNAVAPGFIETEMTAGLDEKYREQIIQNIPLQRMGAAEEVAEVVLFLASPAARYITGQVVNVDGGMVM